ncbi:MAG TPA: hypothetical protein VFC79_03755 [Tissierellaceae bacterium]|nr:hypothetical protein [Tissierellaceae bacterium]
MGNDLLDAITEIVNKVIDERLERDGVWRVNGVPYPSREERQRIEHKILVQQVVKELRKERIIK